MKRTQLIEWGIVTVSLVFGYKFFEGLFSLLVQLVYDFGNDGFGAAITRLAVVSAAYAAAFILLIRRSSSLAAWINGPASANEIVDVKINKRSLLQVILIGICTVTILSDISDVILWLFDSFASEAGRKHDTGETMISLYRLKVSAVQVIVALVIVYFSRDISGWFIRKDEVEELTFDSNAEN